jgi:hypothetical protein
MGAFIGKAASFSFTITRPPGSANLTIGDSGCIASIHAPLPSPHAGNSPNPHGTALITGVICYANDGTGGKSFQVRPEGKGFKMHDLVAQGRISSCRSQ